MSNEAFSREDITLQDGTTVELRPLTIGKKRKFMRLWSDHITKVTAEIREANKKAEESDSDDVPDFDENELTDRQYDMYIKLCAMCLDEIKGTRTEKAFATYLEDTLDDPTIFKVLDVSGGLKLGDNPN